MGVEMSQEQIDQRMIQATNIILCVNRGELPPLPVPMWFGWKDNTVYMDTLAASKKVKHLKANPRISLLVEGGEDYFELNSVLIFGNAEVSEDPEVVAEYQRIRDETKPQYHERLTPKKFPAHLEKFYQRPRAAIKVVASSFTTWDFAKIPR